MLNLFQHLSLNAQTNLVPNWSFEVDSLCPDNGGQISYAPPWRTGGGTPDYYNACDGIGLTTAGVPLNWGGYQYAKTGNAYAAIFCYSLSPPPTEIKEYLQVKLTDSLVTNRKYCVSFYLNLATTLAQAYHNVAITEMGMYISNDAVLSTNLLTLPFTPQIISPSGVFLDDTLNWTEISGEYIAQGGEKYITIGNFNNPTDTFNMPNNNNNPTVVSYYFIDDVTFRDCTNDGVSELGIGNEELGIMPNPASESLTLEIKEARIQESRIKIYNVVGQLIYYTTITTHQKIIDISTYPSGVYFVEVRSFDKLRMTDVVVRKKFVKE